MCGKCFVQKKNYSNRSSLLIEKIFILTSLKFFCKFPSKHSDGEGENRKEPKPTLNIAIQIVSHSV